jgi:hypothetical protein
LISDIEERTHTSAIRKRCSGKYLEAKGGCRKLLTSSGELHISYSASNRIRIIKEEEIGRACSTTRKKKNAYRILLEKLEGKRPLGRSRRRWMNGI